jgi:DNA-binding transcriptional ArsR family regulator/protein-L-isoaspartate O-methyltransferase
MFNGRVASKDLLEVVAALKSAAEPTRLRLLALLSHGELTVGEICSVLGLSQPRVSRHLRLLAEAGFLNRFREQQRVYYRAPAEGRRLEWLRLLLGLLDADTPVLRRDRERLARVTGARAAPAPANAADLAAVLSEQIGPASIGELLDIGTGSGLVLEILGPRAQHAIGVDISAAALRSARARVHGAGFSHCEFRHGDMYGLPYENASFDTITIDRVLAAAKRPEAAIAEAARTLRPEGRLLIVEDFDQMSARADGNPLAQLRHWLEAAGLEAGRLHPCDLAEQHVLVALARHKPAAAA